MLSDHTQHFWLCMAFLAFSCIRYVPVHWIFSVICLIYVVIMWICIIVLGSTPITFIFESFIFVMPYFRVNYSIILWLLKITIG
ncbi:hypothetical protein CARUB_v10011136mg [Capsella rubella]|uniref:Uncharacterized protein n=1 Tax=Capsella rubella TaxID=81985 RepID=R0GSA2_9BRAS|nr:hypothetical protein CARUB_v10011136mg [Capsella rubella]